MDDDEDDVNNDKLSHGYSHYEDIEVLDSAPGGIIPRRTAAASLATADNLYLDPRRPSDHPSTGSLRRHTTHRADRYASVAITSSLQLVV